MYMEFPGTTSPCCVVPQKSQALPCDGCSPLINSRDSATSASSGIKPGRLWRFIVARSIARELKRLVNWRRKRDRQVIRDGDARGAGPPSSEPLVVMQPQSLLGSRKPNLLCN